MLTIAGVTHTWAALHHLQRWTSRNLRTYFGSEVYMRAEGCERDGMVELVDVSLGCITGSVQGGDGTTTPHTVAITTVGTEIQCRCSCDSSTCHHLAAFLLSVSKADKCVVAPFVCGCRHREFNYLGFLMTFRSMEEAIANLNAPALVKTNAFEEMMVLCGKPVKEKKEVCAELVAIWGSIHYCLGRTGVEACDVSESLTRPLSLLKPFYKSDRSYVLSVLKAVIKSACKEDYDSPWLNDNDNTDDWGTSGVDFDTNQMCKICVDFVLAQRKTKQVKAWESLKDCNATHTRSDGCGPTFELEGEVCCRSMKKMGDDLVASLVTTSMLSVHFESRLMKRYFKSVMTPEAKLDFLIADAISANSPSYNATSRKARLIRYYVDELKEPLKAIPWLDQIVGEYANGTVFDTAVAPEMYWLRVQLAETHEEGGPDAALVWIEKGVKVQGFEFIRQACKRRPDKAHEFVLVFASRFPKEYAGFLIKSGRFEDFGAHLSKCHMGLGKDIVLEFFKRNTLPRFAGDTDLLNWILGCELSTLRVSTYNNVVGICKIFTNVDPDAAKMAISKIRAEHKTKKSLLDRLSQRRL